MSQAGSGHKATTAAAVVVNALFAIAGAALAAVVLYPVFESSRFIWVATFAIAAGVGTALVCLRLRWGPGRAAAIAAGAYVVGGLSLAIPSFATGDMTPAQAAIALARGPVLGWKDIVTLPLPLGEYRATLVPVLALLLVGSLLAAWAATRARRWWPMAAVTVVGLIVVAVLMGPSARADALRIAPYSRYLSREFVVGLAAFALVLAWFLWRAAYARRSNLLRTDGAARLAVTPRSHALSAAAATTALFAIAMVTAAVAVGPVAAATPREVVRSVVDPRLVIDSAITPLASYRTYFTDDAYDEVLFTVTVTEGAADRVRVATLPYFDGEEYTAATPAWAADAPFTHVPSAIEGPDGWRTVRADVAVGALAGNWVPLIGSLGRIDFGGARQAQLVDGFYYEPTSATGIMTVADGVAGGDTYSITAYVDAEPRSLAQLGTAPGVATVPADLIPASLSEWVLRQDVSRDGAGLAELVTRLRERGYLSHALTEPTSGVTPAWQAALPGYAFAASAAGHSYDRIDRLFGELLTREAEQGASQAPLVAAIGDDEQFASAVALLAADLGFPSRVVLGARLTDTDPQAWAAPACEGGECRGRNMAVWAEVQGTDGEWTAVDVTPQHTTPPTPEDTRERDPEFVSELDPERADAVAPPSSQRGSSAEDPPPPAAPLDAWDRLGPVLKVVGVATLGFLVLLGPLLAILIWKAVRRRRRRTAAPVDAIHHGWDEYLDTAIDAGLEPLPNATRVETARAYASANGAAIATRTDRVTFSPFETDDRAAREFWALVEADRAAWLAQRGWWGRVRMRLSLRSLWHAVAAPAAGAGAGTEKPDKNRSKG